MVTIAPVVQHSGVHFAAVGLPGMLNAGGAVTACSLAPAGAWAQGLPDRRAPLALCAIVPACLCRASTPPMCLHVQPAMPVGGHARARGNPSIRLHAQPATPVEGHGKARGKPGLRSSLMQCLHASLL